MPTVLTDLLRNGKAADLSSLRLVMCGGSAVPRALIEGYLDVFGVPIVQGWGMTETSPVCAIGHPPKDMGDDDEVDWRARTGRIMPGVELRITDDSGATVAVGRRGGRRDRGARPVDHGLVLPRRRSRRSSTTAGCAPATSPRSTPSGYVKITDRAKDVIKSGGEWVSSVDLENTLMAHPDVAEAAVIGVPDERWDERPLACVVRRADSQRRPRPSCAAGWPNAPPSAGCPSDGRSSTRCPKTSVGKFDKKVLRARHAADQLEVEKLA